MAARYLLDTNCPIDIFNKRFGSSAKVWISKILEEGRYGISVISQIELLGFGNISKE